MSNLLRTQRARGSTRRPCISRDLRIIQFTNVPCAQLRSLWPARLYRLLLDCECPERGGLVGPSLMLTGPEDLAPLGEYQFAPRDGPGWHGIRPHAMQAEGPPRVLAALGDVRSVRKHPTSMSPQ
jgi:hypothetical protein